MDTAWKPIIGYEGVYSISNTGIVRRDSNCRGSSEGRILKKRMTKDGYVKYALYHPTLGKKTHFAHRLVCSVFIRELLDGEEVDHINGIKEDNRVENLEPVSKLENMRRSHRAGRNMSCGERQHLAKLTDELVAEAKRAILRGETQQSIASRMNVNKTTINRIALGKTWRHVSP